MPYRTGCAEGRLLDDLRSDWDDVAPRPVAWTCWYPVADGTPVTERRRDGGTRTPFVQVPLARNAELSTTNAWPLVLLSHGTGGSAASLSWLADRLVRAGHVCIGVDHHGNTATEPYRAEGFLCWWERALDLSLVLDRLSEVGSLDGRIDMKRIGVVGFSLGGHTALALMGAVTSMHRFERWRASTAMAGGAAPREFPDLARQLSRLQAESARFRRSWRRHGESLLDPRVARCVALAPAPPVRAFSPESLARISSPVLLLAGEADAEAPYDECALWLSRANPDFVLRSAGEHVGHYTFLPECLAGGEGIEPVLCRDRPGVARAAVHDETAWTIRAFLAPDATADSISGVARR